ncbi:MAG TPA: Fe-S cluster assembly protein SufD [Terrimicrobiaceae bacterium]
MSVAATELTSKEAEQNWPAWFRDQQTSAWADYEATCAPTRKDEPWRFSNISAVGLSEFQVAEPVTSEGRLINISQGIAEFSAKLVFGNNALLHQDTERLPQGVLFKSLEAAAHENEELFRRFFMAQPVELGSHKYAALHKARLSTGALLYVPKNVEVTLPLEIFHWVEGESASIFPHTLIVCGENSKVTVIDHFKSADGKRALACGVNDLHLEGGAQLNYIAVQEWARESLAFHINSTIVGKDASSTALNLNFGGRFVRGESLSRLVGEGSRSVMLSLNPMDGERQIDQRTLQDHAAPNASSDLLYLNSLDDAARTIFAGLIKVEPGAHRTDAYQKVRNLMLSDQAEANSMPGLEIRADDVRCTHGATSGEISEEELFYMQARGIRKADGRRLIVNGFFRSLLDRLESRSLREYLGRRVSEKLGVPST